MTAWVVLVSLAAAVSFGWSTAAMHFDASSAPEAVTGPLALVRHLLGQWRWLTGMAASLLGLALHALALRLGSLALVQPLVVTGLVFSLLFRAALDRRLLPRRVLLWSSWTAAGLALFLVADGSSPGSSAPDGTAATAVLLVGGVTACVFWRLASTIPRARQGLLLGGAAGINFGLTAGTLKATSGAASLAVVVTTWPLYVLLVLGVSGFLANQVLYRRSSLATSLPVLSVANPLVALAYGVLAFGERPARTAALVVAQGAGLAAVLVGVFCMARLGEEAAAAPYPEQVAGGGAAGATV